MSTLSKEYATLSVSQLKKLLENADDDKEIRVWVEMKHGDSVALEGRRLVGVIDDPNDKFLCIVAGYYHNEEEE